MDGMVVGADGLAAGDGGAFGALLAWLEPYSKDVFGLFGRDLTEPAATKTIAQLLHGDGCGFTPFATQLLETARTTVSRFRSPVLRAMLAPWVMRAGHTPDQPGSGLLVTPVPQALMLAGMPISATGN